LILPRCFEVEAPKQNRVKKTKHAMQRRSFNAIFGRKNRRKL